jgi:hypothetical protein
VSTPKVHGVFVEDPMLMIRYFVKLENMQDTFLLFYLAKKGLQNAKTTVH